MEQITLAGGCFWCTEAIFKRLKGVTKVESGYANSEMENPSYEEVSGGDTGAAEAVNITFDPKKISLDQLLEIFWATHDPTTLNRQGADVGTQYRSAIYYRDDEQGKVAMASKDKMGEDIVTEIAPLKKFNKAEDYHQNYYELNKNSNAYCSLVIDPKIEKLVKEFNDMLKDEYR